MAEGKDTTNAGVLLGTQQCPVAAGKVARNVPRVVGGNIRE